MNDFNSFVLNGSENEHEILRLEQPRLENNEGILLLEQPRSAKRKSQEDHGCVEKRANLNFFSPVKRLTHKEYREMTLKAERLRRPNASPKYGYQMLKKKSRHLLKLHLSRHCRQLLHSNDFFWKTLLVRLVTASNCSLHLA